jgi:hypothetical protein
VILSGLEKGAWLGIVGSGGGLGHLGVQFAKALGLNVVGVDARDQDWNSPESSVLMLLWMRGRGMKRLSKRYTQRQTVKA